MQKFIYTTDIHGQASNPSCRLDDFGKTILGKLKWIGEYAKDINAECILIGGDIVNSPDVSEGYIREMAKIFREYPCRVFSVIGNHDEYGYNPDTFNRTSLGVGEGAGMFARLDKAPVIIGNASITGQDSVYGMEKNIDLYARSGRVEGLVNIHIIHGMLVERDWPMVECTTLPQVMNANPDADLILSGHEHVGFGVKTFFRPDANTKVIFCNPGSLARVTSGTGDMKKDVSIAVITITDDKELVVDIVELPSSVAKSSNEVIDWQRVAAEKEKKKELDVFTDKVSKIDLRESASIYTTLDRIAEENGIEEDVICEARLKLQQAEEEISNISED